MLLPRADQGGAGVTLTHWAPFGVVGVITPVTHSLPTLAGNAINLLAGGNALVCNPHPNGAAIACRGVQLFNQRIMATLGIPNLLTIIRQPTLATAEALFAHRDVDLLCVTGGPAVARAALRSPKRAIVAGPGNPPVVVDATADLERAARCIVRGAAYDNNLLCIAEKEVFAVASIADELMRRLEHHHAVRLTAAQLASLTRAAFSPHPEKAGRWVVNKELIGQDAAVLAARAGVDVPDRVELLFAETDADHPFVIEEQMMPMVPIVRVADAAEALKLAKQAEHGFGHTALVHSRDLDFIQQMEAEMGVSIFVVNGPCMAGLGIGGEGYLSYSIATPTGEGVTTPLTFVRQRRSSWVRGA
jgi:aldehyde dehydrogenase